MVNLSRMPVNYILILNMMDVAIAQGKKINEKQLSERLGIPVLPFTAADGKGYEDLKELIEQELKSPHKLITKPDIDLEESIMDKGKMITDVNAKYAWVSRMLDGVTTSSAKEFKLSKFDNLLLKPFWGKIVTVGIILVGFIAAMMIMSPFMSVAGMLPKMLGAPIAFIPGWYPYSVSCYRIHFISAFQWRHLFLA